MSGSQAQCVPTPNSLPLLSAHVVQGCPGALHRPILGGRDPTQPFSPLPPHRASLLLSTNPLPHTTARRVTPGPAQTLQGCLAPLLTPPATQPDPPPPPNPLPSLCSPRPRASPRPQTRASVLPPRPPANHCSKASFPSTLFYNCNHPSPERPHFQHSSSSADVPGLLSVSKGTDCYLCGSAVSQVLHKYRVRSKRILGPFSWPQGGTQRRPPSVPAAHTNRRGGQPTRGSAGRAAGEAPRSCTQPGPGVVAARGTHGNRRKQGWGDQAARSRGGGARRLPCGRGPGCGPHPRECGQAPVGANGCAPSSRLGRH